MAHIADHQKQKKKRVSKPKVKTGCITCKIRRVKCDEGKPFCQRCQKFGTRCDGYLEDKPVELRPKTLAKLLPRPSSRQSLTSQDSLPDASVEAEYLNHFFQAGAADLAHFFESSFWTSSLIRECHGNDSIRHGVTALGALMTSLSPPLPTTTAIPHISVQAYPSIPVLLPNSTETSQDHKMRAVELYSRSIQSLRSTLHTSNSCRRSVHEALITSLLLICFESLQGSFGMAGAYINGAIVMLQEIEPNSHHQAQNDNVDRELAQIFQRLDSRRAALANKSIFGRGIIAQALSKMLNSHIGWDLSISRAITTYQGGCEVYENFAAADLELQRLTGFGGEFSEKFQLWKTVSRPLIIQIASGLTENILPETALLSILHRIMSIMMQAGRDSDAVQYSQFTPEFKLIILISKLLLEEKQPYSMRNTRSFDLGLIPSLYMVLLKCQDPAVKGQALESLLAVLRNSEYWNQFRPSSIDQFTKVMEDISSGHQLCDSYSTLADESFDTLASTLAPLFPPQTAVYCHPQYPLTMNADLHSLSRFDDSVHSRQSFDSSMSDEWQFSDEDVAGLLVDPMIGLLGSESPSGMSITPAR